MSEVHNRACRAAFSGSLEGVQKELNVDNVNLEPNKWTALHAACSGSHCHIVRYLLSVGAVVDPIDPAWGTPLHIAAKVCVWIHSPTHVHFVLTGLTGEFERRARSHSHYVCGRRIAAYA